MVDAVLMSARAREAEARVAREQTRWHSTLAVEAGTNPDRVIHRFPLRLSDAEPARKRSGVAHRTCWVGQHKDTASP